MAKEDDMNTALAAIDAYCTDGIVPKDSRFILSGTLEYLKRIGSDETEITLPVSVVKKAMETHHLTKDEIKSAVCQMYDPVLVFDSDKSTTENKTDSRLILTNEFKDGKSIALAVNKNANIKLYDSNIDVEVQDIRSIHDRTLIAKNGIDLIKKWTENGLCRYVDDKKITDWSSLARVYFPIELLQSADNTILRKSDIVNQEIGRFTKQIKTADQIIYADPEISRVASLILKNGGSHVQLKGINAQALNKNYNKNNILSNILARRIKKWKQNQTKNQIMGCFLLSMTNLVNLLMEK